MELTARLQFLETLIIGQHARALWYSLTLPVIIRASTLFVVNDCSWPDSDGLASTIAMPWSDLGLFRHFQDVIDLNPQLSDGAFKLRMAEQELDCPQVFRPAVDQGFVRRSVWVPYMAGSRPMAVTQALTIRAYCLVER